MAGLRLFIVAMSLARANSEAACSANAGCAALSGNCCPADDGTELECCKVNQDPSATCSANPGCSHLSGNCCPADDGMQLICCGPAPTPPPPSPSGLMPLENAGLTPLESAACATDITASIAAITSAAKFINYAVEDCPGPGKSTTVVIGTQLEQRMCADDITSAITDFAVASKTISSAVQSCGGPGTTCSQDISNSVASLSASSETLIEAAEHCDKNLKSHDVFACIVNIFDVIDTLTHASKSIYDAVDTCEPAGGTVTDCDGTTAGQKQLHVDGCKGVGCNANGDDQDCAWCVVDMDACKAAYGDGCTLTNAAREEQGVVCE